MLPFTEHTLRGSLLWAIAGGPAPAPLRSVSLAGTMFLCLGAVLGSCPTCWHPSPLRQLLCCQALEHTGLGIALSCLLCLSTSSSQSHPCQGYSDPFLGTVIIVIYGYEERHAPMAVRVTQPPSSCLRR